MSRVGIGNLRSWSLSMNPFNQNMVEVEKGNNDIDSYIDSSVEEGTEAECGWNV